LRERLADLHIHSTHSDGTLTPQEVVSLALKAGLAAVSITDHDNVSGLRDAWKAAEGSSLEVVPGVELSCVEDGFDVHMLGYFVNVDSKALAGHLETFRNARRARAEKIVDKLKKLGLDLGIEAVLRKAGDGAIGRPHIAEALVEEGLVSSYDEVFQKYLGYGGPAYEGKYVIPAAKAIEVIHEAGGVAVLAHPGVHLDRQTVVKIVKMGLDGVETRHPKHPPEAAEWLTRLAEQERLLTSGGSDYHGDGRGETPFADWTIPYSWVEALRDRARLWRR